MGFLNVRLNMLKAHCRLWLSSVRSKRPHGLPTPLTLSLTSYPKRFPTLHLTLKTLLTQTVQCDQVILWVAEDDFAQLPEQVLKLRSFGLSIQTTHDTASYKKIIPALQRFPDHHIITVDDDLYYPSDLVARLVKAQLEHPGQAAANRTHRITRRADGSIAPYLEWKWLTFDNAAPADNFMTGAGGVIYPPGCFHPDVTNEALFKSMAPRADDVWLFWMLKLNGVSVFNTGYAIDEAAWPGSQASALWLENVTKPIGGNDTPIAMLSEKYGQAWPSRVNGQLKATSDTQAEDHGGTP